MRWTTWNLSFLWLEMDHVQQFQISFCCEVCGMTVRLHVMGIDGTIASRSTQLAHARSTRLQNSAQRSSFVGIGSGLSKVHVIAQGAHKQELKLEDAKEEALRRQQQLEEDASTLALGANVPLARVNRKTFDANDMEKHVYGHFAEWKGQRKTCDKPKRRRVESAGDAFGMLMDARHQKRTLGKNLQKGRLHRAMHDASRGVVDKVVPILRFGAFGSMTRCAFPARMRSDSKI
jgi:hypothetical protein